MTNIRRILVPVDFSECSKVALDYARGWAEKFEASIDLLHVWQLPPFAASGALADPGFADVGLLELIREQAEKQMQALASESRERGFPIRSARCELGIPALRIADESASYDLIVIGTHGRTGLGHFLLGSVAERVVQLSKCPVMTVRGAAAT